MKKLFVLLMLFIVATPWLIASPLLSEDFESYGVGNWPSPKWSPDANANSDPSNNRVELDPTNSSNQALKLFGRIGASWGALAYGSCDFTSSFTVETKIYNGSEALSGAHPDRGYLGLRHGTYWYAVTNPARMLVLFKGNGTVVGSDGSVLLGSYDTERWYDIKVQYDRIDDDVSLHYWIDGVDLGVIQISNVDLSKELSYDHVDLTSQEGTVFFDDVLVTAVPEPATLSLLALGGLVLRRRKA